MTVTSAIVERYFNVKSGILHGLETDIIVNSGHWYKEIWNCLLSHSRNFIVDSLLDCFLLFFFLTSRLSSKEYLSDFSASDKNTNKQTIVIYQRRRTLSTVLCNGSVYSTAVRCINTTRTGLHPKVEKK